MSIMDQHKQQQDRDIVGVPKLSNKDVALKWKQAEILGSGEFSVVKRAIEKKSNKAYALKVIPKKHHQDVILSQQECVILSSLPAHENVISLHRYFQDDDNMYIALELVAGCDVLFDIIVNHGHLKEQQAKKLFRQLLSGINFLHTQNIIHRDIKPENILIDKEERLKIIDFGFAIKTKQLVSGVEQCGTIRYIAPEILRCQDYSKIVDVFSAGVVLFVMLSGLLPFPDEHANLRAEYDLRAAVWGEVTEVAKDLLRRCLVADPDERITVIEAITHHWFTTVSTGVDKESASVTTFQHACATGDLARVRDMVSKRKAIVNELRENDRRTSMHAAAAAGQHEVLEFLIQQGGRINPLDLFAATPLQQALKGQHGRCVDILKDNGAVVEEATVEPYVPPLLFLWSHLLQDKKTSSEARHQIKSIMGVMLERHPRQIRRLIMTLPERDSEFMRKTFRVADDLDGVDDLIDALSRRL